jgi:TPP-dependent pyruvate/acetoin dehydrogenase alpha subunit
MRRYPAFDPPEYVDWVADPELTRSYRRRIQQDAERSALIAALDTPDLLGLYRDLLRTRIHDIGLKRWVRTGVISKAWLGTGEEAVTVGTVSALDTSRDVVCPMIRNAGALHMMGVPLADLFRGYLATADSLSGGRDLHIGDLGRNVLQPISHMGTNAQVMTGIALSFRMKGEPRVALTFIGDGATKTAAFHEGVNMAAVLGLPVVFVIQDNQVALGTRSEVHGLGHPVEWAAAYGIPVWQADGNHVLDTYAATRMAVERCRRGEGPGLVVAETFRMGGHATHDEREARETFPAELFEHWGRRDPVGLFETYLLEEGHDETDLRRIEDAVTGEMERAAEEALESRDRPPSPESAKFVGFSEGGPLVGLRKRPI